MKRVRRQSFYSSLGGQGFSLVELLVVVSIVLLLAGGAFVYINDFNAKQKMESTRKEVVANLRLARSYALTGQKSGSDDLNYVEIRISQDGLMEAWPNEDVGSSYYSVDVSPIGVGISVVPDESLFFKAYEGKMLKRVDSVLVSFPVDQTVKVVIASGEGVGETRVVEIKSSGMINEK